jgi:hypothetical protein
MIINVSDFIYFLLLFQDKFRFKYLGDFKAIFIIYQNLKNDYCYYNYELDFQKKELLPN